MSPTSVVRAVLAVCLIAVATGCSLAKPRTRTPIEPASNQGAQFGPRVIYAPMRLEGADPTIDPKLDSVVRVVAPKTVCTGTLIDDDLVLTAHHCVVERGTYGQFSKKALDPKDLGIELGGDFLPWGSVGVKAIVAPPCGEAGGGGDIAVLVLSRKLVGVATKTPRLDRPPTIGEALDPVGFGRCARSAEGIRRKKRASGPVRSMTGETIQTSAGICWGDSGGPVLAHGNDDEIVGVISLSAMDADEDTPGASIFARLDAFRGVFANARALADGVSPSELPPLGCE